MNWPVVREVVRTRRRPTCRWGCICTFRSAASAASFAISASTPTRTPPTSRPTSRPCRARSNWSAACRSWAAGRSASSISAAALLRFSAPSSSRRWSIGCGPTSTGTMPRKSPSSASRARSPSRRCTRSASWASRGSAWASRTSATPCSKKTAGPICPAEVYKAWDWIQAAGFPNVNIDLIAGMVGETWDNWRDSVRRTIELSPDSVTIYQMELPFNTVYSKDMLGQHVESPVADWPTKRAWVDYAFDEFAAAGYRVSSAYTLVKDKQQGELQLSRQSLARLRSVGHRRGQLRPRLGRPLSEPARLGRLRRRARARRAAAVSRAAAHAAPVAGARDDSAAQDRHARRGLFPPQVRRRHRRALGRGLASNIRPKAIWKSTTMRFA